MAGKRSRLSLILSGLAAWRLFGGEFPPRFDGPQERPARIPGRTVVSGRHEFLVRESGPPDAPPLLLIHGWVYDGLTTWHRVVPRLALGHRVHMIDLRGHGKSDQIRGRFELAQAADEVAGIIDALGLGPVPVVGYSMGGMISQWLARRHPGRVSRLVLAATAARPVVIPRWLAVPGFLAGRALARIEPTIAPRIAYRYLTSTGVIPTRQGAWLWESLMARDTDLSYEAGFAILRFDSTDWIGSIEIPTLSVIPTCDQLVPPSAQRETAALLPDNEVVEIEGARHEAVLSHADEVAAAIAGFLD